MGIIDGIYKDAVIVERCERTPNGHGGFSETWTKHLDVIGVMRMTSGQETRIANKESVVVQYRLYSPIVDIQNDDRVKFDGKIFRVLAVNDVQHLAHHMQIDLGYWA